MLLLKEPPANQPQQLVQMYQRQAAEGLLFCARAGEMEYSRQPGFRREWGTLAIMACAGNTEEYFVDQRRLTVSADRYLLLNTALRYDFRLKGSRPHWSMMVCFPRPLLKAIIQPKYAELTNTDPKEQTDEGLDLGRLCGLHGHNLNFSPLFYQLMRAVHCGMNDSLWMESRLVQLLELLFDEQTTKLKQLAATGLAKRSTRLELSRRTQLAVDRIHQDYAQPLSLQTLASTACLSPFHFHRVFNAIHQKTPYEFLKEKRLIIARSKLATQDLTVGEVANAVGYKSRSAFHRAYQRHFGQGPKARQTRRPN